MLVDGVVPPCEVLAQLPHARWALYLISPHKWLAPLLQGSSPKV